MILFILVPLGDMLPVKKEAITGKFHDVTPHTFETLKEIQKKR